MTWFVAGLVGAWLCYEAYRVGNHRGWVEGREHGLKDGRAMERKKWKELVRTLAARRGDWWMVTLDEEVVAIHAGDPEVAQWTQ